MTTKENEFFRQASQRITGTLKIEKALWRFLDYSKNFMPAEKIYLSYFDPSRRMTHVFAEADLQGGNCVDRWVTWPPHVLSDYENGNIKDSLLLDQAEKHRIAKLENKIPQGSKRSAVWIRLIIDKKWIGGFSLWAEGNGRFNKTHLHLLESLRAPFTIAVSNNRRYQQLVSIKEKLSDNYRFIQKELYKIKTDIIGANSGLKSVMTTVERVAPYNSPVLLEGETGVGKEIIATCIHHQSTRRDGPFIKVNCGAIVDTLIDSELFGHEKGSFTGSIGLYRGCFECAEGGTILLDEIGELPQKAQVRFLRVLQEKKIKRIGGGEFIPVDVRVIAASNQSLEGLVRRGRFREDLFFRLNVVPIHIPPLRERREDIPELIEYFIKKKSMEMELALVPAPGAVEVKRLMSYHWPGNVRELENIIERALILNKSEWLSFQECDLPLSPPVYQESKSRYDLQPLNTVVHSYIVKILMLTQGQIDGDNGAAKILNINPSTLRHKMKKLGIPFGREWSKEYFHIR